VNKFIIISYTIIEKFKKFKISTHLCLHNNQNWQLFFTISSYRTEGSGSEIPDLQSEDPDPKLLISDPEHSLTSFKLILYLYFLKATFEPYFTDFSGHGYTSHLSPSANPPLYLPTVTPPPPSYVIRIGIVKASYRTTLKSVGTFLIKKVSHNILRHLKNHLNMVNSKTLVLGIHLFKLFVTICNSKWISHLK